MVGDRAAQEQTIGLRQGLHMKSIVRTVFIISVSMVVSLSSQADLTGAWQGWGIWMFDGEGVNCNMDLRFSETEQKLIRHGGYFECNLVGMETYGAEWTLDNKNLVFEDTIVGSYDGKNFNLVEFANETTNIHTSMTIDGDKMAYEEKWIRNDGAVIYEIYGNFERK